MKQTKTIEATICDFCQKDDAYYKCKGCGKDICFECKPIQAKEYPHAVYFSGSADGLYCLECDKRLTGTGDQLHAAYRVIGFLRDESRGWSEDFKKRADKAEANLKRLQDSAD